MDTTSPHAESNTASKPGTVLKASYVRTGGAKSARAVKLSARLYALREDKHGERSKLETFSKDHDAMSQGQIDEHLDRADATHSYHYRLTVIPGIDRDTRDEAFKTFIRQVVRELERRSGSVSWIAVAHAASDSHTGRAHVHLILSLDKKITREVLGSLRTHAELTWRDMQHGQEEQR